jgi:hypothetical protein
MRAYDNSESLLDELLAGDWYGAITQVYAQTLGMALFHSIVFLLGPVLIGIKYQQFAPVSMAVLAGGTVFSFFFTDTTLQATFAILGVLGFGGILYSVVHK